MAFRWELQQVLAARCGIATATALQKLMAEAGVTLSLESTSALLRSSPMAIRFRTMQALCNATRLKLSDFCEVSPEEVDQQNAPTPLYRSRKPADRSALEFPSPRTFYVRGNSKG
jgi:DNA-binding Xre family transcriptional regulator